MDTKLYHLYDLPEPGILGAHLGDVRAPSRAEVTRAIREIPGAAGDLIGVVLAADLHLLLQGQANRVLVDAYSATGAALHAHDFYITFDRR